VGGFSGNGWGIVFNSAVQDELEFHRSNSVSCQPLDMQGNPADRVVNALIYQR
jgi:hypothetical protein